MTQTAPHILVIDDDARLRDLLSRFLQESGYLVSGAESAAQARAIMKNMQFDLLVIDVMMPERQGWSCLPISAKPLMSLPCFLLR